MRQITNLDEFKWIEEGISELRPSRDPGWKGNFVTHAVPPAFAAYAKLLHPMYEDLELKGIALTWDQEEKLLRQLEDSPQDPIKRRIADLLSGSKLVMRTGECPPSGRRILWKELAGRFGLQVHPEMNVTTFSRIFSNGSWPRYLIGPDEGNLEMQSCARLAEIIEHYNCGQRCYFYYLPYANRTYEPLLFEGDVEDVFEITKREEVFGSPSWWWPADHAWCVNTDWDLTFTLVGGQQDLIDDLLQDAELECLAVTPSTRIDWDSDQINPSLNDPT